MMRTALFVFSLLLSVAAASANPAETTKALDIGSRLELFVDDYLIESMDGVSLKLHEPRSGGKVLSFDKPWEGTSSTYVTVFKDDDRFRMYYRGSSHPDSVIRSLLELEEPLIPKHLEVTCYAESQDGITWTKPPLGIFEFQGSKENNIVWTGVAGTGSTCFTAFKDDNPQVPAQEQYKAIAIHHPQGWKYVMGLVSSDGLRWQPIQKEPIISQKNMDSGLDLAFWDGQQQQYIAYLRDWRPVPKHLPEGMHPIGAAIQDRIRNLVRSTSPDFLNWSEPEFIDLGDAPLEHFYTGSITPYFRAPHIYVAVPKRFLPWRNFFQEALYPGLSDGVFLTSRDGERWDRRFMEAFIRPGREKRDWMNRSNMTAAGVVPTAPDEISLYVVRHYKFPSIHLERMVVRTDGFVSVHAGYAGGELLTRPLVFQGDNLSMNFATSAAGSIRLEIQDVQGNPLPGFALEESPLIWGDEIEHTVRWERSHAKATSDKPLARIAGKPVRLRFVMKDADLYSLRFR